MFLLFLSFESTFLMLNFVMKKTFTLKYNKLLKIMQNLFDANAIKEQFN